MPFWSREKLILAGRVFSGSFLNGLRTNLYLEEVMLT
jgi:hypothetical protein